MTETTLIWLIIIPIVHWFADFVLQNNYMAKQKAVSNKALLLHTVEYSATWLILLFVVSQLSTIPWYSAIYFAGITFITHTAVDYCTSRLNRKLQIHGQRTDNYHDLFVSIGFDQLLHVIQLILCYYFIIL